MRVSKQDWMMTWVSLVHAATFLRSGLEAELRKSLGISLAEQDLIKQLHVSGGNLTLGELGKRIYFSKAGITRMLDRLEVSGLVRRQAVEGDRRSLTAVLTGKGEQTLAESRRILKRFVRTELRDR
ncbi:MAG: MarR family transcriptional regulator, partial [Xanthomonadales bacterium]|nr:MarR family transcriptional regulator [Xanthomonadales bacterium]